MEEDEVLTEKKAVLVLLDKYKEKDCLWNTTHKYYNNKLARHGAIEELLAVWKKYYPRATFVEIKKKIECLRASFRREWQKVKAAEECGNTHYPRLWYFKKLLFLVNEEAPELCSYYLKQNSENNLEVEEEHNETSGSEKNCLLLNVKEEKDTLEVEMPQIVVTPISRHLATPSPVSNELSTSSESSADKTETTPKKRKANASSSRHSKIIKTGDESSPKLKFEAYGQHIAERLRNMTPKMAIYCQKIMNDAIFMAETEDLDKCSYIVSK